MEKLSDKDLEKVGRLLAVDEKNKGGDDYDNYMRSTEADNN